MSSAISYMYTYGLTTGLNEKATKSNGIVRHHSNGIGHKPRIIQNGKTTHANGVTVPVRSASDVCNMVTRNGQIKTNGFRKDGNANLTRDDCAIDSNGEILNSGVSNNNIPPVMKSHLLQHDKLIKPREASNNEHRPLSPVVAQHPKSDEKQAKENDKQSHREGKQNTTQTSQNESQQAAKTIVNTKQKVKRNSGQSYQQPELRQFYRNKLPDQANNLPVSPLSSAVSTPPSITPPQTYRRTISQTNIPNSISQASSPRTQGVRFAEYTLPPGVKHLVEEHFAPGVKGFFQRKTQLPLLKKTDAAMLSRRPSLADASAHINKLSSKMANVRLRRHPGLDYAGDDQFNRYTAQPGSVTDDLRSGVDMRLIRACWNVVLAFMGDQETISKHHGSGILNNFLPSRKKFHIRSESKKSSGYESSGERSKSPKVINKTQRPKSMFLPSPGTPSPAPSSSGSSSGSSSVFRISRSPNSSQQNIETNLVQAATAMTVLQKVHFLCNVGIKLPYMRDEIYCIVIKQIVANPSLHSTALGWVLLSLISATFLPSAKIYADVRAFVSHQKHEWGSYCGAKLNRNLKNGVRANPPCTLEIQGAQARQPIKVPVICTDHSMQNVTVDSASTATEILTSMGEKLQMKDSFGYCLVLASGAKVMPLGGNSFKLMDGISQVESYCRHRGMKISWRLYHRRDIFSPRDNHISLKEEINLWLAYSQICGGIYSGEYVCKKASDLSLLVSHRYCLRYGLDDLEMKKVQVVCEESIPPASYKEDRKNWALMVYRTLEALQKKPNFSVEAIDILPQVVRFGIKAFRNKFTRSYTINSFTPEGGSCSYTSGLTLTVSHVEVCVKQGDVTMYGDDNGGVTVMRTFPSILMKIDMKNLRKVKLEHQSLSSGSALTIISNTGESFSLTTVHGSEIYSILFRFIRDVSSGILNESSA